MTTMGNILCTLAVTSSPEVLLGETVDLSLLEFILLYLILAVTPDYKSILQNLTNGARHLLTFRELGLFGGKYKTLHQFTEHMPSTFHISVKAAGPSLYAVNIAHHRRKIAYCRLN